MKRLMIVILGWVALALPTLAASFDCAKASTKVEKMICDNPDISKLDDVLAKKLRDAIRNAATSDEIKRAQKEWIATRNNCTDSNCVSQSYRQRLSSLDTLLMVRGGEIKKTRGRVEYVEDSTAMEPNQFEHENAQEACGLFLQNLRHLADGKPQMSCGQQVASNLRSRIEAIEWENVDPNKYPGLFREVFGLTSISDSGDEVSKLHSRIANKEYIFRRAKLNLVGHPFSGDRNLSSWAREYASAYEEGKEPELSLTIIQFGANVNSNQNPDKALRCDTEKIRGAEYYSDLPHFLLVTSDMKHVYGVIQAYSTSITPQYLWRISGRIYGEGFSGGDIELSEFGSSDKGVGVDKFFFEPVCFYRHHEMTK